MNTFYRLLAYLIIYPFLYLALKVTVEGRENLPAKGEALIIICNHFSWFEAALLYTKLPYQITFLVSSEVWQNPLGKRLANAFVAISVHRGRPDRKALKQGLSVLSNGGVLGIFPEGGIDPDLRQLTDVGTDVFGVDGRKSRIPPRLITAKPGAAYFAVKSGVQILPTAVLNGEMILTNIRKFKRTPVKITIGAPFGPLALDKTVKGHAKREALTTLGNEMMLHIADLLPPEQHGYYTREL